MINLQNVSKTYVSKSKNKVEALKEANFTIGDSGMTFILGKSGSGKSTLLNLLGGLDRPTSGEIVVDGVSMSNFTQGDYDGYRNGYVGFVFQEYNLLDDFNVQDNVAIALQLSKDNDVEQKVISALEQVELNKEYLKRRIGELSGGEKQRVAIARAIIKDSKMILADEPTGNLDSATGESVWNILKNLSKERAVVVVSHDRESALKYSDRIIEIADGVVIADNGSITNTEPQRTFTPTKQRLPFKVCLKMGANSLLKHKVKTVSVILVSIFTILALLISQLFVTYSAERVISANINRDHISYITLAQGRNGEDDKLDYNTSHVMKRRTQEYIAENSQYIQNGYVKCKQDILDMGLTFIGNALELDDESFYVTSSMLDEVFTFKGENVSFVEVDGEIVPVKKSVHTIDFLVGKKVYFAEVDFNEGFYTLAGVIDDANLYFATTFATDNFTGYHKSVSFNYGEKEVSLSFNNRQVVSLLSVGSHLFGSKILTEDGLSYVENEALNEDEIIIDFTLYKRLFGAGKQNEYINYNKNEVEQMIPEIGQKVSVKLRDYETEKLIIDLGELTLKGVTFDSPDREITENDTGRICVNYRTANKVAIASNIDGFLVRVDSIRNLTHFLTVLRNDHLGYVTFAGFVTGEEGERVPAFHTMTYSFESEMSTFAMIFGVIALALLIAMVLMVINLISFSITNRKRDIGILSAIGVSNWDVMKIFILETLIISVTMFILGLCSVALIVYVCNVIFSKLFLLGAISYVFIIDPYAFFTLVVASFGLLLLATLIPTRKIAKSKPIDAIRSV